MWRENLRFWAGAESSHTGLWRPRRQVWSNPRLQAPVGYPETRVLQTPAIWRNKHLRNKHPMETMRADLYASNNQWKSSRFFSKISRENVVKGSTMIPQNYRMCTFYNEKLVWLTVQRWWSRSSLWLESRKFWHLLTCLWTWPSCPLHSPLGRN